jgi:hypothetical protein
MPHFYFHTDKSPVQETASLNSVHSESNDVPLSGKDENMPPLSSLTLSVSACVIDATTTNDDDDDCLLSERLYRSGPSLDEIDDDDNDNDDSRVLSVDKNHRSTHNPFAEFYRLLKVCWFVSLKSFYFDSFNASSPTTQATGVDLYILGECCFSEVSLVVSLVVILIVVVLILSF